MVMLEFGSDIVVPAVSGVAFRLLNGQAVRKALQNSEKPLRQNQRYGI
jgi:hypothetical protein